MDTLGISGEELPIAPRRADSVSHSGGKSRVQLPLPLSPNRTSSSPCPLRVYGKPASAALGQGPQALIGHHSNTPSPPTLWPSMSQPNGTSLRFTPHLAHTSAAGASFASGLDARAATSLGALHALRGTHGTNRGCSADPAIILKQQLPTHEQMQARYCLCERAACGTRAAMLCFSLAKNTTQQGDGASNPVITHRVDRHDAMGQ